MREIKFNFYNTKTQKYTRWEESNAGMSMCSFYTHEYLKFLQYTGLKDKNGKEVYEGDIVKYLDAYDCSTENGYDYSEFDNKGVIEWEESECRYSVTNRETVDLETFFESEHIEVIGNIYENPELLKGENNNDAN